LSLRWRLILTEVELPAAEHCPERFFINLKFVVAWPRAILAGPQIRLMIFRLPEAAPPGRSEIPERVMISPRPVRAAQVPERYSNTIILREPRAPAEATATPARYLYVSITRLPVAIDAPETTPWRDRNIVAVPEFPVTDPPVPAADRNLLS
jgi:hypothetical protein